MCRQCIKSPPAQRRRWRSPSPGDIAPISNGQGEMALLDRRGNIVSWNLPDADGIPVIHELYDAPWKTAFFLGLDDRKFPVSRRFGETNHTLVSTWANKTGRAQEQAWMVGSPNSSEYGRLARQLTCESGTVNARLDLTLCYGYRGEEPVRWTVLRSESGCVEATAEVGGMRMFLTTNMQLEFDDDATTITGRMVLEAGQSAWIVIGWRGHFLPRSTAEVDDLRKVSEAGWSKWVQSLNLPDTERLALVILAAILLRGLGHRSGAFYAAASRGLPEDDPAGVSQAIRVWDYLFCWLRDAGLTVDVLDDLGDSEVLLAMLRWYQSIPDFPRKTKIMYTVKGADVGLIGEHVVEEYGHRGAIFRYGNGAGDQDQSDRWAYPLGHLWRLAKRGVFDLDLTYGLAEQAEEAVLKGCCGIWEVRRKPGETFVVYAAAQVLNAQALYFASKIFKIAGMELPARRFEKAADKVKPWVLENCVFNGVVVAAPGMRALDSSILLAMLKGQDVFDLSDPGDRQLVEATVKAIDTPADAPAPVPGVRGLGVGDGYVRYHTDELDDGISPDKEALFSNVTGWVARMFLRLGDVQRAKTVMKHLWAIPNDVGVYTEEVTVDGEPLANVNQAYAQMEVLSFELELEAFLKAHSLESEAVAA